MDTPVDKAIHRIKSNKLMATLVVLGIIIVALGTVTGALSNIWDFATTLSKPTKSESVETQTNESVDKRQMKLEEKLNQLEKHHSESKKVKKEKEIVISNSTENKTPVADDQEPKSQVITSEAVKLLVTTLRNIEDDYYALLRIQSGVREIPRGISGSELALIINTANIADDYYCLLAIQTGVRYLVRPISSQDVESIIAWISDDYYRLLASNALQN